MATLVSSSTSLLGRWTMKPRYVARPSKWALDNGLRFLCLWDTRIPIDLVSRKPADTFSGTPSPYVTPWGLGHYIGPYATTISWASRDEWNITGELSIMCRHMCDGNYYYPLIARKGVANTDAGLPFVVTGNHYYGGTGGGSHFVYRGNTAANARVCWENEDAYAHMSWMTKLFAFPAVVETKHDLYMNSRKSIGIYQYGGSDTGAAGTNTQPLVLADANHQSYYNDFTAIFAKKFDAATAAELIQAPMGMLLEEDDFEKRTIYFPRSAPAASNNNQRLTLLGVGD